MENTLRIGEAGVVNFAVYCEDLAGIVSREGVTEVKLPAMEKEGEGDYTLALKFNPETITMLANTGIYEKPLDKQGVHQIEIRVAVEEKDPDSEKIIIRAVKHVFHGGLISLDGNTEIYEVAYWKAFVDNRKVKDAYNPAYLIDLRDISNGGGLTKEFLKEEIAKDSRRDYT